MNNTKLTLVQLTLFPLTKPMLCAYYDGRVSCKYDPSCRTD